MQISEKASETSNHLIMGTHAFLEAFYLPLLTLCCAFHALLSLAFLAKFSARLRGNANLHLYIYVFFIAVSRNTLVKNKPLSYRYGFRQLYIESKPMNESLRVVTAGFVRNVVYPYNMHLKVAIRDTSMSELHMIVHVLYLAGYQSLLSCSPSASNNQINWRYTNNHECKLTTINSIITCNTPVSFKICSI